MRLTVFFAKKNLSKVIFGGTLSFDIQHREVFMQAKYTDKTLGLEFKIPIGEELAMEMSKLKAPEGYAVIMLGYGDPSR